MPLVNAIYMRVQPLPKTVSDLQHRSVTTKTLGVVLVETTESTLWDANVRKVIIDVRASCWHHLQCAPHGRSC
jgi:hypothetical protein